MRSCSIRVWASPPLPCTCSSSPGSSFSLATSAAMSPPSSVGVVPVRGRQRGGGDVLRQRIELARDGVGGVGDARPVAAEDLIGFPSSRNALAWPNQPATAAPKSASPEGICQPPCSNPPSRSSPAPPGACMTPIQGQERVQGQPHRGLLALVCRSGRRTAGRRTQLTQAAFLPVHEWPSPRSTPRQITWPVRSAAGDPRVPRLRPAADSRPGATDTFRADLSRRSAVNAHGHDAVRPDADPRWSEPERSAYPLSDISAAVEVGFRLPADFQDAR